jgi:hypothetical protein
MIMGRARRTRNGLRAIGERGNSLLKMTFRALHNVSLDPMAHRCDRRRSAGTTALRPRPYDMTTLSDQILARKGSLRATC